MLSDIFRLGIRDSKTGHLVKGLTLNSYCHNPLPPNNYYHYPHNHNSLINECEGIRDANSTIVIIANGRWMS